MVQTMGSLAPAPNAARALHQAYRDHAEAIRRALSRLGVPERDLDDAVHEVFVVLLRRFGDFDRTRGMRAWLYGIARRVASHHRRAAARKQNFRRRLGDDDGSHRVGAPDPYDHVARTEAAALLGEFLDELGPDKSAVFVLSHVEGLRGPEIAEALDTNLNTVYWRLRAARSDFEHVVARKNVDVDTTEESETHGAWAPLPFLHGWRLWGERVLHGAMVSSAAILPFAMWPQVPHAQTLPQDEVAVAGSRPLTRVRLAEVPGTDYMDFDGELVEGERPISWVRTSRPTAPDHGPRYVRTRLRPPPVDTAISRTGVAVTIRSHINEIRACYNDALKRDPEVQGRVGLLFRIESDAHAHDVRVDAEGMEDTVLQGCVADAVTSWRFPVTVEPGARPVEVHYPIQLRPMRPKRPGPPGDPGTGAAPVTGVDSDSGR